MAESHAQGPASSPETLHWVFWTATEGGGGALKGHGR